MGYSIAYNSGTTTPFGTYKQGTITMGLKPDEYTVSSGFTWYANAETPNDNYLIISDTYSQGWSTQSEAKPTIWRSETGTTESFVSLVNQLPDVNGVTGFTNGGDAMGYLQSTGKYFVSKDEYLGIVTDGLVLNLDAGWYPSYSGSGTTWKDLKGTNNGTLINGPTFSGGSIVFDGVDDYSSTTFPISNNSDFSVGLWVNLDSGITTRRGIVSTWDISWKGFGIGYGLDYPNMSIRSWVNDGAGGGMNWDTVSTYEGSFHYLVLTYDYSTGTQKGYIDSIYKVQETYIDSVTHSTFQISRGGQTGSPQLGAYSYMSGKISNLHLYNKVLSTDEIIQNYNVQKGRFGL